MKMYELNFRDMAGQALYIGGEKIVDLLVKMNLGLDNLKGGLFFGYIDHTHGFMLEVLALITNQDKKDVYNVLKEDVSFKIPRLDVQDMDVRVLKDINMDVFKVKIEKLIKETQVDETIKNLRAYEVLDPSRHSEFPDDLMVYFLEEGKDPEACWVRLEGMKDGKMIGTLLTAPKQNIGVKVNETLSFGLTDMEDGKTACVWVKS